MNNSKTNTAANRLTTALFVIYLVVLLWILLLKLGVRFSYMGYRRVNLIPFHEPLMRNGRMDIGEIILNAVIFVPLGVYAGMLFRRWTIGKKIGFFFLVSFTVEALQYILAVGASDITDIIMNTIGGMIGLLLFKAVEKAFGSNLKAQKFINIIAATGTLLMIVLLVLLKMNKLPIRYQ